MENETRRVAVWALSACLLIAGVVLALGVVEADGLEQALATPSPFFGGLSDQLPQIGEMASGVAAGDAPVEFDELAQAVERANLDVGATTLWQGGALGVTSSSRMVFEIGQKLPAFGLMTRDGQPFRTDLLGKPYLLNFWASWCGPCVYEFPLLIEHSAAAGAGFDVAFINIWDDPVTYDSFLQDYPSDLLVMIDLKGNLPEQYRMDMIPVTVLIDAQSIVQMVQIGPINTAALDLAEGLIMGE